MVLPLANLESMLAQMRVQKTPANLAARDVGLIPVEDKLHAKFAVQEGTLPLKLLLHAMHAQLGHLSRAMLKIKMITTKLLIVKLARQGRYQRAAHRNARIALLESTLHPRPELNANGAPPVRRPQTPVQIATPVVLGNIEMQQERLAHPAEVDGTRLKAPNLAKSAKVVNIPRLKRRRHA